MDRTLELDDFNNITITDLFKTNYNFKKFYNKKYENRNLQIFDKCEGYFYFNQERNNKIYLVYNFNTDSKIINIRNTLVTKEKYKIVKNLIEMFINLHSLGIILYNSNTETLDYINGNIKLTNLKEHKDFYYEDSSTENLQFDYKYDIYNLGILIKDLFETNESQNNDKIEINQNFLVDSLIAGIVREDRNLIPNIFEIADIFNQILLYKNEKYRIYYSEIQLLCIYILINLLAFMKFFRNASYSFLAEEKDSNLTQEPLIVEESNKFIGKN